MPANKDTKKVIRLACGQLVCRPGDVAHQVHQIEALSAAAARQGARLILFGEAALTGYRIAPGEGQSRGAS